MNRPAIEITAQQVVKYGVPRLRVDRQDAGADYVNLADVLQALGMTEAALCRLMVWAAKRKGGQP